MKAVASDERRRSERIELKYKLTLHAEQKQRLFGTVKDISREGLSILTLDNQEEGDDISMVLHLPEWLQAVYGKSIEIIASWRWCNPVSSQNDNPFYMAGYEFELENQPTDSRFFIEHVLEGIPDQILQQI